MAVEAWFRAIIVVHYFLLVRSWTPFYSRGLRVPTFHEKHPALLTLSCTFAPCPSGRWGDRRCITSTKMSGQALTSDKKDTGGKGAETAINRPPRVLGLGSAGVDFIAIVERYPAADAKIRTESLDVMGGGNCGNTLSAASRLGLDACLATKVGSDANGRLILEGLKDEGVDVSRVIVSGATPSAFTYIIVDKEGGTRTCLHTPQTEDILPEEITAELLEGVAAVHLDSRHTAAAVALATLANQRGVPVVLDAEKDRPHMKELLPLADFVICNQNYPMSYSPSSTSSEAAIEELLTQGRARVVVTTLGEEGCIVVARDDDEPWQGFGDFTLPKDCSVDIKTAVSQCDIPAASEGSKKDGPILRYLWAPAWPVNPLEIVDTTGAGDCFIAGFVYGLTHRLGISRTVALASFVAASKLSEPGARRGVPTLAKLRQECPELLAGPADI